MRVKRAKVMAGVMAVLLAASGDAAGAEEVGTQERETEGVRPVEEQILREHLRKLVPMGISQLMRTQQEVDREQKRRANTTSNPQELALLADDEDAGVRFQVATNRHTPRGTILALADDSEPTVRSGVALELQYDVREPREIRQLKESLAVQLSQDPQVLVRLALVSNGRIPAGVLDSLALDEDQVVRRRVAASTYASKTALAILAQDSVLVVQTEALANPNAPSSWLRRQAGHSKTEVVMAVCRNINTPGSVLDSLSVNQAPDIRASVARHQKTRLETLARMAKDKTEKEESVLLAIASHPQADRSLLTYLAYDARFGPVRLQAQTRLKPLLRKEIREDILERWKN